MEEKDNKLYISVAELAEILGISRVAVFKRIKSGKIPAEKIGRNYIISMKYVNTIVEDISPRVLTDEQKEEIGKSVDRVIAEYGETLKLLGKE